VGAGAGHASYQVYAINPLSAARYRERHVTSGAKSDPGDTKVLADLVRTDRQHHRPIAGGLRACRGLKGLFIPEVGVTDSRV